MAQTEAPPGSGDGSYDEIESALAATSRGRRFLAETARRSRSADTQRLLDAVAGLERRIGATPAPPSLHGIRDAIAEMADVMRRTKAEIIKDLTQSTGMGASSGALDDLAEAAQRAAHEACEAAESIQEIAWTMREGGFDAKLCDALDQRATEICTASAVQDAVSNAVGKAVRTLAGLDGRIAGMCRLLGVDAVETSWRPPLDELKRSLTQGDIDFVVTDGRDGTASA